MRRSLIVLLAGLVLVAGSPLVFAAAPTVPAAEAKVWGDDPLDQVYAAADAVNRCGLPRDAFVAAMLAPSWPETGAPDTLAPSPMTLSRWDNQSTLYAFENPGTPYRRAFWHPGIGLWQFDSAGLGAPFTASQRVDIRVMATAMAQSISARYCASSSSLGVPDRLNSAWQPWHGCNDNRCLAIWFQIYNVDTHQLRGVVRNARVTSTGGMQARTCRGPGISGTASCWRVDPSKAEGYGAGGVGWASTSSGAPAPLTAPFYVYAAGGYEYRHWLRADTGYGSGVWARRPLGANARGNLQWAGGESLCDVTSGTGACCPPLPVPHNCAATNVSGSYRPVAGDFNADGVDDIIWYAPGTAQDYLWQGTVYGRFVGRPISVGGTGYVPVAGDFDGNGTDDVLWYKPGGTGRDDILWRGKRNGTFTGSSVLVAGTFTPTAGDFDGDGRDDVLWYGDGAAADFVWYGTRHGFTSKAFNQAGTGLVPLAANYDGDQRDDVFFYGADGIADAIWYGNIARSFVKTSTTIGGSYLPVAGRLNRGRRADVLWYGPGEANDVLYLGAPGRTFEGRSATVDEVFVPFAGDFNGNGVEDIFWYGPGGARDAVTLNG